MQSQKWPEKRPYPVELSPRAKDETASKETEAVAAPPAFTEHMTDVACAEGDDIALECRVAPAGDPKLQTGEMKSPPRSSAKSGP